ncbi:flagellar basal body-associated FliL family protein [Oceanicoccus sp. KOV_DT_Chl]|uniref:flagellar basal body-associated FliL family protein n=1 Tax=Oceanicoccus sp. KOV_DT_Chl TaxID=1904639 RepID=UPI000C7D8AF1|nr:flagellar basal body-associated FliL family protein [Oceanicoccus sp. KOV_DT_Chl]
MRFPALVLITLLSVLFSNVLWAQEEAVEGEGEEGAVAAPTSYIDLKPAFIVNYGGAGKLRYLKTDIALRLAGGPSGQSQIRHHMPYLRHTIVMRLSRATEEELASMEGRELLRLEVLEEVRVMLTKEEGKHFVDDLLFNSFIVQR